MDKIRLASLDICSASRDDMVGYINHVVGNATETINVIYANSNLIVTLKNQLHKFNSLPFLVLNDGVALDAAAKLFCGKKFISNLNGTDFTPYLIANFSHGKKLFLLGGEDGVAEKAGQALSNIPGVEVVGVANGFNDVADTALIERINSTEPDIVLVAMGNPRQEKWILENSTKLAGVQLTVAVGALFDFLSGNVRRAPLWVQRLRLEWLFRLLGEPKRLLKRYSTDMLKFFFICLSNRGI